MRQHNMQGVSVYKIIKAWKFLMGDKKIAQIRLKATENGSGETV